jgi:hypothetical protein
MHPKLPNLLPLLVALACIAPARAELVPVAWDANGRFAHDATVAPGKFVEVCEKLAQGTRIAWAYDAAAPLDFNIHYHEGKQVRFPAKQDASAAGRGLLEAAVGQDYCWMWTNRQPGAARLSMKLERP